MPLSGPREKPLPMIEVPASATLAVARANHHGPCIIVGAATDNTRHSYATGWRQFTDHTRTLGSEPLGAHPAAVATFLGHLGTGGASEQTLGARWLRSGSSPELLVVFGQ
jgi:hypothetical protein